MTDYTVVWDGRGPLPGMESDAWQQRHGPELIRQAPGRHGFITQKEIAAATHVEPCNDAWLDAQGCPPKPHQAIWSTCRGCGARQLKKQLTVKLQLCAACGPGPKVAEVRL